MSMKTRILDCRFRYLQRHGCPYSPNFQNYALTWKDRSGQVPHQSAHPIGVARQERQIPGSWRCRQALKMIAAPFHPDVREDARHH